MNAHERRFVSNESSGLNIHLAANSFSWPMLNESRNQNPGTSTNLFDIGRRGGLVVERCTPEREVGGSILTRVAVLYH